MNPLISRFLLRALRVSPLASSFSRQSMMLFIAGTLVRDLMQQHLAILTRHETKAVNGSNRRRRFGGSNMNLRRATELLAYFAELCETVREPFRFRAQIYKPLCPPPRPAEQTSGPRSVAACLSRRCLSNPVRQSLGSRTYIPREFHDAPPTSRMTHALFYRECRSGRPPVSTYNTSRRDHYEMREKPDDSR